MPPQWARRGHFTQFDSVFRGSQFLQGVVFRWVRHALAMVRLRLWIASSQVCSLAQQSRADCNSSSFSKSALTRSTQRRAWRTSFAASR